MLKLNLVENLDITTFIFRFFGTAVRIWPLLQWLLFGVILFTQHVTSCFQCCKQSQASVHCRDPYNGYWLGSTGSQFNCIEWWILSIPYWTHSTHLRRSCGPCSLFKSKFVIFDLEQKNNLIWILSTENEMDITR